MRFYLSFLLVFLCVFATAQVPPMVIGGPQGIDVTRILARNWMSIPIYIDTPAAPLTGSGWPGRGYIVHVAKANDTTVWHYTGTKWQKIGGVAENRLTVLVDGGKLTRNPTLNRFTVGSAIYYIQGQYYTSSITQLNGFPKTPNANGRIDIVALGTSGPLVIQGTESTSPVSPVVTSNRIKLGFVYYPPFDSLPTISGNGIEAIFRKPGVDSIFFSTSDTTLSIRDSIGIAAGDTATMLNPYKFTAANGLTKDSTVFRLGGSLNQNTNINLNTRRLTIIGGADTIRFFSNGRVSIGGTPDSTYRLFINNGGIRTDSLIVNNLYSKFGRYIGDSSVPFAPIEFRATSGNRMRIDLRPASNGGWNSNWYGAITHNGPETDILYSNYGTLYLGSSLFTAGGGIYIGGTRSQPAVRVLNNSNVLIGDTANTGFRLDVNGRARVRDTLTLTTTPVTSDTTANDLLVINSSNGQVRRYTGTWPVSTPTLQQVTTAGNSTTNPINIIDNNSKKYIELWRSDTDENGVIYLHDKTSLDSGFVKIELSTQLNGYLSFKPFRFKGTHTIKPQNNPNNLSDIFLPDSSGILTQRVAINGTTYNTAANGVIDMNGLWINGSATLDFPSTNGSNKSDLTITVTGASEGDVVSLGIQNSVNLNHSCFTAWVSATDTVTVRFSNYGTGALDPVSATFKVKVFK